MNNMGATDYFMKQFPKLNSQLARLQAVSEKGLVAKDLFRVICIPDIWFVAYTNIYANKGAVTAGVDEDDTLDGMSPSRIRRIIASIKEDTFRPTPVKRVPIPKKDGGVRPLGIPTGTDRLVQEVMRIALEHVYEPSFLNTSHGFRPERSCHTALRQTKTVCTAVKWFVEFDIKGFFDNVSHAHLVSLIERKIDDKRFIRLLRRFLKAGYMEKQEWYPTYSGMPQGGVISPLLSNIYLHELDQFVASLAEQFNKGKRRTANPVYNRITRQMLALRKEIDEEGVTPDKLNEFKTLERERLKIPRSIQDDDKFKRLVYCRYADDFIFGVNGTHQEAKDLLLKTESYLRDNLHLDLSPEKTCVQRATKGIEFLSYGIKTQYNDKVKKIKTHGRHAKTRTVNGAIVLTVPQHKVRDFCKFHNYGDYQRKRPLHRPKLLFASEAEIIHTYNAELRGFANYYGLARDMKISLSLLFFIGAGSLFGTFANKRKSSKMQVINDLRTNDGFSLYAQVRDKDSGEMIDKEIKMYQLKHFEPPKVCIDRLPLTVHLYTAGSELYRRMNAYRCEYCGNDERPLEVHHIRKLKDLKEMKHLEHWQKVMIARHRKTMILCSGTADSCHVLLHQGKLHDKRFKRQELDWRAV